MTIGRFLVLVLIGIGAFVGIMVLIVPVGMVGGALVIAMPYAGLPLVLLLLLRQAFRSRWRQRRALTRAALYAETDRTDEPSVLTPGPTLIHGKIAYAAGATGAMRVEITQLGSEYELKSGWVHHWTETGRTRRVQPFYLEEANGTRIRVEPSDDAATRLCDQLASIPAPPSDKPAEQRRIRVAELSVGEQAWVEGLLAEADDPEGNSMVPGATSDGEYRSNARPVGWVLRGGPRLLVTTVSLAQHYRERAALHRRQMIVAVLLLLPPAYFVARFADRYFGQTETGTVVSDDVTRGKHGEVTGHVATVRTDDGQMYTSETLDGPPTVGGPFTLRVGRHSTNDGAEPRFTTPESLIALVIVGLVVLVLGGQKSTARSTLPWFRAVDPFKESGQGRLTMPPALD